MGREVISQVGNVTSNGVDLEVHDTKARLQGRDRGSNRVLNSCEFAIQGDVKLRKKKLELIAGFWCFISCRGDNFWGIFLRSKEPHSLQVFERQGHHWCAKLYCPVYQLLASR